MDFDRALRSDSIRAQAYAATFLAAEGGSGSPYIAQLLSRCKAIDLNVSELSNFEQRLVSHGAMSLCTIVNASGYDGADRLHASILEWIHSLPTCRHIQIAGTSIHALSLLGVPPQETRKRLEELIGSDRRPDDYPLVTLRGTAFRCLAGIDRQFVERFLDTPACADHITLLTHWLENAPGDPNLIEELNWLTRS
ncbi:hypothetical protein CA13_65530 [Planctomycetes bacterium CA13]|uniref:Uncharacterized protein n=1 Tax=Novipirellula herctigrandis TaxID=2527986 RepID=A0A5C5ZE01_9BACT|nr:hypothetical protein CA13_65530 [Planctomycetes bacterium CA13]